MNDALTMPRGDREEAGGRGDSTSAEGGAQAQDGPAQPNQTRIRRGDQAAGLSQPQLPLQEAGRATRPQPGPAGGTRPR